MELLQLRYFLVVARTEHMTRAAAELHISQPSLSKTIRQLERELGVALFDRGGRAIRLNRFGAAFRDHAEAALREVEAGRHTVRELAGLAADEVSIVTASLIWLPQLMHAFQRRYPAIQFRLAQAPLSEIARRIETGACDFGLQSLPIERPGIDWQPLLTHELLLVVAPDHHLAGRTSVPLGVVADEPVIIERQDHGLRDLIDQTFHRAGLSLRVGLEIDEPAAIFSFVAENLGVAFTPAVMRQQAEERGLLTLRLTDPPCSCTFGIAWQRGRRLSEAARTFRQFLLATVANDGRETPPARPPRTHPPLARQSRSS